MPDQALPEIAAENEEGFADFVFALEMVNDGDTTWDGTQRFRAVGRDGKNEVAFDVVLGSAWRTSKLSEDMDVLLHWGEASLCRVDARSDALLGAMARLYGVQAPARFSKGVRFSACALSGDPERVDAGLVKLKLFFEHDDKDRYAELYLNLDVVGGRIELKEKDREYRAAVLSALGAQDA